MTRFEIISDVVHDTCTQHFLLYFREKIGAIMY